MTETIYIGRAFHGPPDTGHGGYLAGLLSHLLTGAVEVTIRRPPPLERDLSAVPHDRGLRLLDGDIVVAEARRTVLDIDIPPPVSAGEAERASRSYLGFETPVYPDCLACGPDRTEGDGLRVFTGPVRGRDLVAGPWIPGAWIADEAGLVRPEFIWAALDCPGAWALHGRTVGLPLILGRLAARLINPVVSGHLYVVMAWPMGRDGRKGFAGSAVLDAAGELCAVAHATWIRLEA